MSSNAFNHLVDLLRRLRRRVGRRGAALGCIGVMYVVGGQALVT